MADETQDTPKDAPRDAGKDEAKEVSDDFTVREHTAPSGLRYTTTTGRLVLRREETTDGKAGGFKPKAEIFVVAYTKQDAEPDRPVTFAFNGGPGSASVWLHLGLLGPRLVDSGDVGAMTPAPFGLVDNPESLLESSDLVMIDPVSTGYSRVVEGEKADFAIEPVDIEPVG